MTAPDPSVEIADVNASDAARAAEPTTRAARRADRRLAKAEAKAGAARAKAAAKAERAAAGRRRRWPRIVAAVVVVLAVAAAALAGWWYLVRVPTWAVPAYTGRNATELVAIPADHQWTVRRTEQFADGTEPGRILAQDPAAGTELARGGTLAVTVSLGPPPVAVPTDLTGKPLPDATNELTAAGLTVGGVERRFDESAPADQVLAVADGTATELPKGSGVGLVVSAGPEPRTIPDGLVGRSSDQVTSQLRALGLEPATTEEFSETVPKGTVLAVKPETGAQVPKGGAVQVTVSKGPPTVTVPNVAGLSVVDAGAKLEAAGLVVSGTQGSPTKPATGTNPAAGQVVRKGTSVAIVTG